MDDDSESVKKQGDLVQMLCQEDLDPYSVQELKIRKSILEQEVKRTEDKISVASDHLSAAQNLFK